MNILDKDKLLELEDLCIQEQPPAAMAACPLRVECKTVCEAVAQGQYDVARSVYSKTVPLPHVLSCLCDMPCASSCVRKDFGGAINLRGLEWAAMQFGKQTPRRRLPMRKSGKVAVVGAGPFGLTAALELARKGFSVSIYEKAESAGGSLLCANIPEGTLEEDLKLLEAEDITFYFDKTIDGIDSISDKADLKLSFTPHSSHSHTISEASESSALADRYDAIVLAVGKPLPGSDHVTMITPIDGVFSGGDFPSLIEALAAGKRVSNTVNRFVKNVSMTAERGSEMNRATKLYVETKDLESVLPIDSDILDREMAQQEASRCVRCECMECAKACAFIAHYKRYPKLYLREVYNNLSIAMGNRTSNTLINSCALCDQCGAVCPYGLNLGEAIQSVRDIMVKTNKMPKSAFEFAVDDMLQANNESSFFVRHQPGMNDSRYLFFPGCQLGASAPDIVEKTYNHLCDSLDGGVAFMHGCCGIMAKWAGREELFNETKAMLKKEWESLGSPTVIVACPTCRKSLDDVFKEVEDVWTVLLETGIPDVKRDLPVTIHDACGARDCEGTQQAVRELLSQLGCQVTEPKFTKDKTPCCGYGGLVQFSHSNIASELTEFCLRDIDETNLTYCMGCRDRFAKAGARSIHLLELIFGTRTGDERAPGYSLRQDNRALLKRSMLRDLWNEEQEEVERLILTYDEDLGALLEKRLILEEDVRAVIEEAEATGRFIEEMKSHLRIAHKQIGNVTYWVYYAPEGEGWRVRRAYSHRMEIR